MYINRSIPTTYVIYAPFGLRRVVNRLLFFISLMGPVPIRRHYDSIISRIYKTKLNVFRKIANFSCRDRDCPILAESHVVGTSSASCRLPESAAPRRRRLFGGVKSFTMFGGRSQTQGRSISLPESTNLYNFVSSERKVLFFILFFYFIV